MFFVWALGCNFDVKLHLGGFILLNYGKKMCLVHTVLNPIRKVSFFGKLLSDYFAGFRLIRTSIWTVQ